MPVDLFVTKIKVKVKKLRVYKLFYRSFGR